MFTYVFKTESITSDARVVIISPISLIKVNAATEPSVDSVGGQYTRPERLTTIPICRAWI